MSYYKCMQLWRKYYLESEELDLGPEFATDFHYDLGQISDLMFSKYKSSLQNEKNNSPIYLTRLWKG